ncbi:MAG: hypothetical protein EOO54_17265 [Haliea sp.]|nr:MAG: hypothetical protein EOO54_17265 [Haliea sp.]
MPHRTPCASSALSPASVAGRAPAFQNPRKFANNPLVRQWLVLRAIQSSGVQMYGRSLQKDLDFAFAEVAGAMGRGVIDMDYRPANPAAVDIPPFGHPHHIQAMLYWSTRLRCTLPVLTEAHERLGKCPSFESAGITVRRIEKEERLTATWANDVRRPHGMEPTMPMLLGPELSTR